MVKAGSVGEAIATAAGANPLDEKFNVSTA